MTHPLPHGEVHGNCAAQSSTHPFDILPLVNDS